MENTTILKYLQKHAEETPDKLCIGDKKNSVTYSQFWTMVQKGAEYLRVQGIQPGDVVVIRAVQKVEYLLCVFSVQLLGAITCPLEKAIKDDRILEIMGLMNTDLYMAEKPVKKENIRYISFKALLAASQDESLELGSETVFPAGDCLADILFTTGTTGKSKGIEVTHACNVGIAENVNDSVSMTEGEVELITTPINHSLAIRRTYGAIYTGSSVVLTDGIKFVEDFFKLMDGFKITAITFVPAILEQVLKFAKDRFAKYDEQLHYIQLGSAPLSEINKKILREMFPNVRLYNTYGATESGCTIILEFSKYPNKEKCIGRTTVNTKVLFVDDDRNEVEASLNTPGYLAFSGPMNMNGYRGEPELTKEVLDENNIIYTNDLGYPGEDGLIYLLGRKGDVINMGGIKVAPTEIEEVAAQHPTVKDCACVPVPDEITGEAVKMFVVPADGVEFDQVELTKYLLSKLESLKVPKVYELIDEIPRTFNGKIIRKELKCR